MIEIFSEPFFWMVLFSGFFVSILFSILSPIVVLRDYAFAGLGITHSIIGGLGIGLLLGIPPFYSMIIISIIVGLFIGMISIGGRIRENLAIGILFPFMMAVGIISIYYSGAYSNSLLSYLFGNILLITKLEFYSLILFTFIVFIWFIISYRKLLLLSFDLELAKTMGINTNFHHLLFSLIIALTVALGAKLVGIILVSALLVIPGATSLLIAKDFKGLIFLSVIFGIIATLIGLILSVFLNIPSGASIVVIQGFVFAIVFGMRKLFVN